MNSIKHLCLNQSPYLEKMCYLSGSEFLFHFFAASSIIAVTNVTFETNINYARDKRAQGIESSIFFESKP